MSSARTSVIERESEINLKSHKLSNKNLKKFQKKDKLEVEQKSNNLNRDSQDSLALPKRSMVRAQGATTSSDNGAPKKESKNPVTQIFTLNEASSGSPALQDGKASSYLSN